MKNFYLAICLVSCASLFGAESNPVACTINQEEYNKDEAIFLCGMVVLANVIQIFLEPHNLPKVKRHVDHVLQGVVTFAQELFKKEKK
jgi:hypothetical protein